MSTTVGTHTFDNLIGGSQKPIVQRAGTVAINQVLSRGELVGKLTSTGYWQECDFTDVANYDDFGLMVEAIDTSETGATTKTTIYVEGEFNESAITFDYGDDADDWRETLAGHGIYLRKSVGTDGVVG